tara:strand:- start:786 stop:1016 length:231 start_codon:yes stop_codon:yes gene_type:complete
MKDLILKELYWLVISILLSLFLSFIFLGLLSLSSAEENINQIEKVFTVQLYLIGCLVSMISIYIFRIVTKAIKKYI